MYIYIYIHMEPIWTKQENKGWSNMNLDFTEASSNKKMDRLMVLYDGMDDALRQLHVVIGGWLGIWGELSGSFRTSGETFRGAFSGFIGKPWKPVIFKKLVSDNRILKKNETRKHTAFPGHWPNIPSPQGCFCIIWGRDQGPSCNAWDNPLFSGQIWARTLQAGPETWWCACNIWRWPPIFVTSWDKDLLKGCPKKDK